MNFILILPVMIMMILCTFMGVLVFQANMPTPPEIGLHPEVNDMPNMPVQTTIATITTTENIDTDEELCSEKWGGLWPNEIKNATYPYNYDAWIRVNCSYEQEIPNLVTVLVNFWNLESSQDEINRLAQGIQEAYPGVKMIVGVKENLNISIEGVEMIKTNQTNFWGKLLENCKTKYVVLGFDLDYVTRWIDLHRGIRLLGKGHIAVGGAVRNSTGYWRVPCYQVALRYYRLEMREGYSKATDDCMVCDFVGGPVLVAKENLSNLNLTDLPESVMMLDWNLKNKGSWLACPDIMYHTATSIGRDAELEKREVWRDLANIWEIQGVVTEWELQFEEVFNCEEIGLTCDSSLQANTGRLQTWCCHQSFLHILNNLEKLADENGLQYEMSGGTMLGAVKIGNYMPWDIDVDLDFFGEEIEKYKVGGDYGEHLIQQGIKIRESGKNIDLLYQGLKVEMWNSGSMSTNFHPEHLRHSPTRIQMGKNLWLRTYANPGLSARGWYGPMYLYHSESWGVKDGMNHGYDQYFPGEWMNCSVPGHHACLSNYPNVGNIGLLPNDYP